MRRVRGIPPQRVEVRHKGGFHTVQRGDGSLVMAAWPRKRGPSKSPYQVYWQQAMRWAMKATSLTTPQEMKFARELSDGTMYLPRDLLVRAMFGTLAEIVDRDGQRWWSVRQLTSEVQALLDQISQEVGVILTRGADGWIAIGPGDADYVLTANGPGNIPSFKPGGSGPGAVSEVAGGNSLQSTSTAAYASRGAFVKPLLDYTITRAWTHLTAVAGQTYQAFIFEASGTILQDKIAESTVVTADATETTDFIFTFTPEAKLEANKRYALLFSRTSASGTTSMGNYGGDGEASGFALAALDTYCRTTNAVPDTGDGLNTGPNPYFYGLVGYLTPATPEEP